MTAHRPLLSECRVCKTPTASDAEKCTKCATKDPFGWVAKKEELEFAKNKALFFSMCTTAVLFAIFLLIKFWEPLANKLTQ